MRTTRQPIASGILASLLTCAARAAAPAADQKPDEGLQEIIVTAGKRAETQSKTPIALTAMTQADLTHQGVVELRNLNAEAPSVHFSQVSLANSIQVTIRGITDTNFNSGGQSAVATYVDGVLVPRTQGLNGALYDIERIEILRGPQGTLYGRNSPAGNINILTAGPDSTFDASAAVSAGNFGEVTTRAMVNVPLSDTFAVRLAGSTRRSDGFYETAHNDPSGKLQSNYGAADDYNGRISASWKPTQSFSWRLTADWVSENGTPGLDFQTGLNGQPADGHDPFRNPQVPGLYAPELEIDIFTTRSRMDLSFGSGWSLAYIAGYQNLRQKAQSETAGAPVAAFATIRGSHNQSQYQEVNLIYDQDAFFNVLGANYTFEQEGTVNPIYFYAANFAFAFGSNYDDDYDDHAYGVFDQLTYRMTDNLRLTGGVRYSDEKAEVFGRSRNYICPLSYTFGQIIAATIPATAQAPCSGATSDPNSGRWSKETWRAGLEYDLAPHTMGYVTYSTGFKAGGLNPVAAGLPLSYAPENTTSYEAGIKGRFFDNTVKLNSDAFYTDYSNLQVVQFLGSPPRQTTTNAAKAKIYGVELDGQINITNDDTVSGFANWVHARYSDYTNAVDPLTNGVVPSLNGNHLANSPDWSFRLAYRHEFALPGSATLTPDAAIYWQSLTYLRGFNLPIDKVGSYGKMDFNLSYVDPSAHWTVQGYVHNAANKINRNTAFVIGYYFSDFDPPRTFGARVSYQF